MKPKRRPASQDPAVQAIAALRKHSRECRNIETRQYLLAVERRMVQLFDLGFAPAPASLSHPAGQRSGPPDTPNGAATRRAPQCCASETDQG